MKGTTSSPLILLATLAYLYYTNATVTVSPESQQPTPCNSCCQGPAGNQGNPGIPGSNGLPGTNGMPGSMGLKGERGESVKGDTGQDGQTGQKGEVGDMGLKRERGTGGLRGPPGKVGPVGIAGSVGSPGTPGVKGQKGEMGQSRVSAFSAARRHSFTPSSGSQALPFDSGYLHTNVGDDFDAASGRFTCEIPGIYLFTYSIMTNPQATHIKLMKNEVNLNSIYRSEIGNYDIVSNSAVLQLAAGDQVWLKCYYSGRQVYSDSGLYTTFSGVILHET